MQESGLIRKINAYIETNRLLIPEKPVIVGFSGGCDSVSLLFILNRLGYNCIAAHCNFHLRGVESDQDEDFCRMFAAQHSIPFEKVDFETRSYAAGRHLSVEMAARELRYEWFETQRSSKAAQAIALAHHSDDSNETMLLNIIRGTGIRGLCGIRPRNGWIVRPLRCVSKEDIIRFVEEHHLPFRTDSSNLSETHTRNLIRLRLLPLMKTINPSVNEALNRTAAHLTDVENIYLQTIGNVKKTLLRETEDDVFSISIHQLKCQHSPQTILYELVRDFGFTRQQSKDIYASLSGEPGKIFDAPATGYQLEKDRTALIIYKKPEQAKDFSVTENNTDFERLPIRLSLQTVKVDANFDLSKSHTTATFDYKKIRFPLILRKWRSGDWFIPFGMKGRKKISDYFSDQKYNLHQKNKTWLLCSGKDILWIVGERVDNRFRVDSHTKYAVIINFFPTNFCCK